MSAISIKILAFDDDRQILHALEEAISTALPDASFLAAATGDENLALALAVDPDVILLGAASGWRLCCDRCRRFKGAENLAAIPILVLASPSTSQADRWNALDAGADGFLSSPFAPPELVAQIRAMTRLKAANRLPRVQPEPQLVERLLALEMELAANAQGETALHKRYAALEQILDTLPQGIFWKDAEGRYLGCNRVFATRAGLAEPSQIIGLNDFDLPWTGQEAENYRADDRQVLETNRAKLHIIEPLQVSDGSRLWIDTSKVPLTNAEDQPYAVLGIYEDITERKWATLALDKFFDQPMNLHLIAQLDSVIVRVNLGWENLLGYTRADIEGTSFLDLVHPDDRAATLDEMAKLGRGNVTFYFENRYRHKNGDYRILAWSALASVEERLVYAVATDITERKEAEVALLESEVRYRSLLERALIGIAVFIEQKLVFTNPMGAKLLGAESPAQLVGRHVAEFVHPDYHPLLRQRLDQINAGYQNLGPVEYLFQRLDGKAISVETISTSLFYQGKPAVQVLVRDITEQKQAEAGRAHLLAQVQAQALQLSQILDAVPDSVLLLDREARVLLANSTARGDLPLVAHVGVGDRLTRLGDLPIDDLLTTAHNGSWYEFQVDKFIFEATARSLSAAQPGSTSGHWVVVFSNVTQERSLSSQLQQQERLAAVGQLAAGIAHDFNNILAIIALQGTMAAQTPHLPADVHERLKVINEQATQATRLVQQMLDFSRRSVLDRRPLNLGALLQNLVDLLARTLPEHIEITLHYEPDDYMVLADPTHIQQMVMNLALNARDAMPHGGSLRLTLTHERTALSPNLDQDLWIRMAIADTGTGIAPEVMAHLFEPFFTTKPRGRGTGLGLAQVYGIVKQHAGEIFVDSTPGQGTTFVVYLPTTSTALKAHVEPADTSVTMSDASILLVEDNPLLLDAMSDMLSMIGYTVICAANGKEALAVLDQDASAVDLVLSDLIMPQMDGDRLIRSMRERGLSIPVVILSGHPLERELDALKEYGLAGWLLKPPNIQDLIQLIADVLTINQSAQTRKP